MRHQNELVPKGAEFVPQFRESALHIELGNLFDGRGYVIRKRFIPWIEIDSSPNKGIQIGK